MELKDYVAALRRYWLTWVGITLLGLLVAVQILSTSTPVYEARAQVFVASSSTGTSQAVSQRVKSYPDVAVSLAVLGPVIVRLDMEADFAEVRQQVRATNPVDTSLIVIVATSSDPQAAADLANAVAAEFVEVVAELERPESGVSPVSLTVTSPATAPKAPSAPTPLYVLGLGLVVGLLLGLALAIVRSKASTALYDEPGIRAAWGDDEGLPVLIAPPGSARRSALAGRPANALARRLELMAEGQPVRVLLLAPSPHARGAVEEFAAEVLDELRLRCVSASSAEYDADPTEPDEGADVRVRLEVGNPMAPLRVWRRVAEDCDGVVLVVPCGQVVAAELEEMRTILRAASLRALAVVATRPRRGRVPAGPRSSPRALGARSRPSAPSAPSATTAAGSRVASTHTTTGTTAAMRTRPLIDIRGGREKAG